MKLITTTLAIISIIGLLSTLICGLWIKNQPSVDPSSIKFHMTIGIAFVVLSIITMVLQLIANKSA